MTAFPSITAANFAFGSAEDPLTTGWTGATPSGNTTTVLKSAGGVCLKNQPSGTGFGAQYTSSAYGPDMECWGKIVTRTATNGQEILGIFLRLQQEGAATVDGYYGFVLLASGTDTWEIDRLINNSGTSIATGSRDVAAGDFIGMKVEDSGGNPVVTMYWCPAANDPTLTASWTQVCTATDSNVAKLTGTGKIGLEVQGIVTTLDDFRIGTIVTGGTDANVTAPVADGVGDIPAPTVTADSTVTAPVDDGTGDIPTPAVTADSTVTSPPADGTGDIPDPAVTTANDATVTTPVADGTGDIPAPSVTADSTVTSPAASGTGDLPSADTPISVTVETGPLSGTGDIPAPTVGGTGDATVTSPVLDGTGDIPTPAASAGSTVTTPAADGTGDIPAPAVTASATVTALPADGTGDLPSPSASGGTGEPLVQMVALNTARTATFTTTGGTTALFLAPARSATPTHPVRTAAFQRPQTGASFEQAEAELVLV